jgi:hypothetical protein
MRDQLSPDLERIYFRFVDYVFDLYLNELVSSPPRISPPRFSSVFDLFFRMQERLPSVGSTESLG